MPRMSPLPPSHDNWGSTRPGNTRRTNSSKPRAPRAEFCCLRHIEQGTGADAQQSALVLRSRSWTRLTAGVRRQFIRVSAAGRRDEATDKSIWRAAEDGPSVRVLAPQYGVIRHPEPAGIIGIVGKDQDLPMALLDPRLGRRAIVHRAARFAVCRGERAIPSRQRISTLMRRGDPGGDSNADRDGDRMPHIPRCDRGALLVQPDVLEARAVIDAVDHADQT